MKFLILFLMAILSVPNALASCFTNKSKVSCVLSHNACHWVKATKASTRTTSKSAPKGYCRPAGKSKKAKNGKGEAVPVCDIDEQIAKIKAQKMFVARIDRRNCKVYASKTAPPPSTAKKAKMVICFSKCTDSPIGLVEQVAARNDDGTCPDVAGVKTYLMTLEKWKGYPCNKECYDHASSIMETFKLGNPTQAHYQKNHCDAVTIDDEYKRHKDFLRDPVK